MPSQKSTKSALETEALAINIASSIRPRLKGAFVIALQGDLGSGKTTFARGFARGLGIKGKILSPTFLIIKAYKIPLAESSFKRFVHVDCYRLKSPKELLSLGWKDIMADPRNVVLVEWADMAKSIIPKSAWRIRFSHKGGNERGIMFKSSGLTKSARALL
ncbi:MAG: tRNA (adenosine(37)-N6)-threonylcarbamoyltransferase complex ATPase subunit type 1 TsaE [Candidatus Wildermuthbacteria bacterium]|nr:tRNA (adenosine(37)-N6)-threonylcarbamoyltransferase complex ATPase subunit type 1 TsaE [Candidatus Wildermuthbacteria bacterium]